MNVYSPSSPMKEDLQMPDGAHGPRVLVVDDEPNLAEVVTMALRFNGFTVETAATGREALAAVSKRAAPGAAVAARRRRDRL